MDRSFSVGQNVMLISGHAVVARGVVETINPNATCHSIELGQGRSSVRIVKALLPDCKLPVRHGGAETVYECVGSFCIWSNRSMVADIPSDSEDLDGDTDPNDDGDMAFQFERQYADLAIDFTRRSSWVGQDVAILCPSTLVVIGHGFVSLSNPSSLFQGSKLGEDNVGVVLNSTIYAYASDERRKWFPSRIEGLATLIKWPMQYLMFTQTKKILSEIEITADLSDQIIVPFRQRKRTYCFKNRTRGDPEKKRYLRCKRKAVRRVTNSDIDGVARVICCTLHCTKLIARDDIKDARLEYYGVDVAERWKTVYSHFRDREIHHRDDGMMVFRGTPICKYAFCAVYGMCATTFYQRRDECLRRDAKVGYHGNSGSKKPHAGTLFAKALLLEHLQNFSECMPHETYNGSNGTDHSIYKLPSSTTRKDVYQSVNDELEERNLAKVSNNTLRTLWNTHFANYQIHSTSAFAKCSICTLLKDKLQHEKRVEQRAPILAEKQAHIDEAISRRSEYYANRLKASKYPSEYLSMIHDKMDQAKTWIPRLSQWTTKLQMGHALPMALTGMILHGRSPGVFGHWSLKGLFPGDPDFTVTSLAKAFRDFEAFNGDMSGDLSFSPTSKTEPIFSALLDRRPFSAKYQNVFRGANAWSQSRQQSASTRSCRESLGYNILPKHLLLQMDNSGKDNKNQTVMAFCSELVARGIFVSVTLSFLMVGHTHEDIDAFFSKVNAAMQGKDISTLPELMAEVANCQKSTPISSMIQEVAHYSAYVKPYVKEISGQSAPIAFFFTMKNNRPVYQIKETLRSPWTPPMGRVIWKDIVRGFSEQGCVLPDFQDEPKPKPMTLPPKDVKDIETFLGNFLAMKRQSLADPSSEGCRINAPLIQYWESVMNILRSGTRCPDATSSCALQTKFWPRTNHGTGYKKNVASVEDDAEVLHPLEVELGEVNEENNEMFVGTRSEKQRIMFTPLVDIAEGSFALIRPDCDFEKKNPRRVWLVRARSKIMMDKSSKHFGEFQIEWWRPRHRNIYADEKLRYACSLPTEKKTQVWEQDPQYPKENEYWQSGAAAIYAWKTTAKKITLSSDRVIDAIEAYLADIDCENAAAIDEHDQLHFERNENSDGPEMEDID